MSSATHPSKSTAWLGWLQDFKKEQRYIGRYSVEKLYAFHEYQEKTSIYRVMAVIVLTPLPTALVLWGLDCIPLPDPRGGAKGNTITYLRSILSHTIMTFMVLNCGKQALGLNAPGTKYTHTKAILISICAAVVLEAWWLIWAFEWRFPTPCRELFTFVPWMSLTVLFTYIFARADFRSVWDRLQRYIPVVGTQVVLYYFLLFLSVGFIAVPWWAQITMIFLFPVVKLLIKRALWKYARNLHDLSADVTICMVEISGSLYQTVCMNYVESKSMVILLLVLDFVQVAHEAHLYIRHDYIMDSKSTLQTAMSIVEDARTSDAIAEKLTADISLVALPFDENTDEQHTPGTTLGSSRSKDSAKIQPLTYAGPIEGKLPRLDLSSVATALPRR